MRVEAEASRVYWQAIAEALPRDLGFEGRNHDSEDQMNLALNYSYAILYSECWRALTIAGLDPYAGFIHKDRSGREGLVYDFSEMFKPSAVDVVLVNLFRNGFRLKSERGYIERGSRAELAKAVVESFNRVVREDGDHNLKKLHQALRASAMRLASSLVRGAIYKGFVEVW